MAKNPKTGSVLAMATGAALLGVIAFGKQLRAERPDREHPIVLAQSDQGDAEIQKLKADIQADEEKLKAAREAEEKEEAAARAKGTPLPPTGRNKGSGPSHSPKRGYH